MMKITGLSHLFKWENLHNWWLTKYFFAPLYIYIHTHTQYIIIIITTTIYQPLYMCFSMLVYLFKAQQNIKTIIRTLKWPFINIILYESTVF